MSKHLRCEVRLFRATCFDATTVANFDSFEEGMDYIRDQWLMHGGYVKAELVYNNCLQATIFIH